MIQEHPHRSDGAALPQRALSRWENEGGFVADSARGAAGHGEEPSRIPELKDAELVQLRIRVIALESLVTVLLAEATDRQLDRVREMAAFISPRPGFTPHSLTIRAATQMLHLVERAGHFRTPSSDDAPSLGSRRQK